jgi:glycosyltransferase involved in cell wall biosynthesis
MLLRQALESVQAQDFTDFECIVVDDASDNVGATEHVVAALDDRRFRVVRSRSAASSSRESLSRYARGLALNIGVEQSSAPWLAFLDDDDLYAPYRLSRGVATTRERPGVRITVARSGAFSSSEPVWDRLPELRLTRVRNPLAQMIPHSSTWMLSRSLAYDVGLFRPYGAMEDWEFYSRLWAIAEIWRDEATTVSIRRHDGVRHNYGVEARIRMREDLLRTGSLRPNRASFAFQLYRLSQLKSQCGDHVGAVSAALRSLIPVPYPRYVGQTVRAVTGSLRRA